MIDIDHTFVTSDHHFSSFGSLLKRTTEEEDAQHILSWNEIVGEDDLVLYVGDFCDSRSMKDFISLRNSLNGRIVLIKGNHDDNLIENHDFTDDYLRLVFDDVVEELVIDEIGLQLLHNPDSALRRPELKLIHGHIHNADERHPDLTQNSFCCCACKRDWKPVRLCDALRLMGAASV